MLQKRHSCWMHNFTIVELLAVMTIIVILISLLITGVNAGRKKSMEISCASNLKQISTANIMYISNNRSMFPVAVNPNDFNQGRVWMGKMGSHSSFLIKTTNRPLNQYIGYNFDNIETPITKCPFNDIDVDSYNKVGSSYSGNAYMGWNSLDKKRISSILYPSCTVLSTELGALAYLQNDEKSLWRMTHKINSPIYPFLRVDGSIIIYSLTPGEGLITSSKEVNFDINKP